MSQAVTVDGWIVDASLFVHFCVLERVQLLFRMRRGLKVPEYVYRIELVSPNARQETRERATAAVAGGNMQVQQLTLADVARIAALGPRRSAAVGELACAVLAERQDYGVLCDDRRAQRWLGSRMQLKAWEDIETVLVEAAHRFEVTEYELAALEATLLQNRYACRCDLRNEYLMQRLALHERQ